MRPNKPALSPDIDLFRNRLDNMIDRVITESGV